MHAGELAPVQSVCWNIFLCILVYVGELALVQCAVDAATELALVQPVRWNIFLSILAYAGELALHLHD